MRVDQILKWVGTFILAMGGVINSLGYYPLGPIVLGLGSIVWLIVAIMWKEKAMIVTNGFFSLLTFGTLTYSLFIK